MADVIVRATAGFTEVDWPDGCVSIEPDGGLYLGDSLKWDATIPPSAMAEIIRHHPATADLRRQLEQARSVAVQLEEQLARVTAAADGLVVDDGLVWWVSDESGASAVYNDRGAHQALASIVRVIEAVSRG